MDIIDQLMRDEGYRPHMYKDSSGHWTIGYGCNLDSGISKDVALHLLMEQANEVELSLAQVLPWVVNLDDVRRGVLINMAFNMGINDLLQFHNTLAFVKSGQYAAAAKEMLDSDWANQVGVRATRLSKQMETGVWQ